MSAMAASGGLSVSDWSRSCVRHMSTRKGFATADVEATRRHLLALTQGRCRFTAGDGKTGAGFTGAQLRLGSTSFQFLRWNWESECETSTLRPPGQHIVLYLPLSGVFEARQGAFQAEARPGEILVAGSTGELTRRWRGRCELLNIVVPRDALGRMLAVDYAIDPDRALEFEPLALVALERAGTLLRFVETVISDLNAPGSIFSEPCAAQQAERTLLHIILKCIPQESAERFDQARAAIAPYYVRRAEDFIRSHIQEDISIEQLTAIAGVSARTLFYGFKHYRKASPMQFLKNARMALAHAMILEARINGGKIREIAARAGYRNPSQFSRDYKEHFGESPLVARGRREGMLALG